MVRVLGFLFSVAYSILIVWLYAVQPRTMAEVTGGLTSQVGAYRIDAQSFDDGLAFFRRDQFVEARAAFARADPAERDAPTQFYVGYSFYRQGWGRVYNDDTLFALVDGVVKFEFKDKNRQKVSVYPAVASAS